MAHALAPQPQPTCTALVPVPTEASATASPHSKSSPPSQRSLHWYFKGTGVHKRKVKAVDAKTGTTYHLVGPRGKERVVSARKARGDTLEYEGPARQECLRLSAKPWFWL